MESVPAGVIGGTFGGNALACASALKVIEIMERDHLADRALEIGQKVCARYEQWKQKYDVIGDYRGLGAMLGLEFVHDKASKKPYPELVTAVIKEAAQHGLDHGKLRHLRQRHPLPLPARRHRRPARCRPGHPGTGHHYLHEIISISLP